MSEDFITEEIRTKLREPFPAEAISQHPTKSFLSTIKAIYIVERLNDVFGVGGWDLEHEIISDTEDYVAVKGRLLYVTDAPGTFVWHTPYQYGGHKKTGTNTEPADGYKSAVTDCQSKCASYLEIGIDVFKGLHTHDSPAPKQAKKEAATDGKELSKKQWDFIKKLGENIGMTEEETVNIVKWVATENNLEPRNWKISKLMLPEKNFAEQLRLYSEANIKETMSEELEEPF